MPPLPKDDDETNHQASSSSTSEQKQQQQQHQEGEDPYRHAYPNIEQFIPNPPTSSNSNNSNTLYQDDIEKLFYSSLDNGGGKTTTAAANRGHVNYYTLLGVSPNDSDADIRRAFRHLSVMFHPDRTINLSNEVKQAMSARFCLINEAYQVLSDPIKRAAYDCLGKQGVKELSALLPAALKDDDEGPSSSTNLLAQYLRKHPEATARLLQTAHEEKNLLKTAKRLGNTSELDVQLNAVNVIAQMAQIGVDMVSLTTLWFQNKEDTKWSLEWDDPIRKEMIETDVQLVRQIVRKKLEHEKMLDDLDAQQQQQEQQQKNNIRPHHHLEARPAVDEPAFYSNNTANTNSSSKEQSPERPSVITPQQSEQQQEQQPTPKLELPPPPKPISSMKIELEGPAAVIVGYQGENSLAFVPDKTQREKVTADVKKYQETAQKYQEEVQQYQQMVDQKKKKHEALLKQERLKRLEEKRRRLAAAKNNNQDESKTTTPETDADEDMNNVNAIDEDELKNPEKYIDPQTGTFHGLPIPENLDQEIDVSKSTRKLHRPPMLTMLSTASRVWLWAMHRQVAGMMVPLSMKGRYAWQLPLGSKTASLFSVSASRQHNGGATFETTLDAERKSSPFMTWLWSFGLRSETGGTRFSAGFQRVLSKIWIARLKIAVWRDGDPNWIPEIFIQFQRKLSETLTLIPHIRLPSPFKFFLAAVGNNKMDTKKIKKDLGLEVPDNNNNDEDDDDPNGEKWGTVGVQVNGAHGGLGVIISKGSLQFHYALEKPFVLFPLLRSAFSGSKKKDDKNEDKNEEDIDEESGDEFNNTTNKKKSAIPFLRRWTTTIEKSIQLVFSANPIFRHEDVLWFSKPFDALPSEKDIEKATGTTELSGIDNNDSNNNNNSSSDDDTESDDDDDVIAATERRKRRMFVHGYRNQRFKDEVKTLADSVLSHGFGIGITSTVPIFHALFPSTWPQNRGINVALSLHYKKGENKISLPIRVSFDQSLIPALALSVAPYLFNRIISDFVSKWSAEENRKTSLKKRISGNRKVQRAYKRARLEQEGMEGNAKKLMMEESQKKFNDSKIMNGGLVIINARFGILEPVLEYPGSENNNNNDNPSTSQFIPVQCDVTIPIQNLVRDSKIHIAGGASKSVLAGIFDPQPWSLPELEKKQLEVTYRFRNRLHKVVIDDKEELRMPLVEHLVKV